MSMGGSSARGWLAGLVAGCGSVSSQLGGGAGPGQQDVLTRILPLLPEPYRDNVLYIDRYGNVFANRPDLASLVQVRPLGGGLHAYPDATVFVGPPEFEPAAGPSPQPTPPSGWVPPPCNVEPGAFRRVLSWPGHGPYYFPYRYAAFSTNVWLPDPAYGQIHTVRGDTAYIHTGGWGERPDSTVDAGFQYNANTRTWSLFIKAHGRRPQPYPRRLQPGQYALLQFWVVSETEVAVRAQGLFVDGSSGQTEPWGLTIVSWRPDGLNNRLKRVTSIAQVRHNPRSGSYMLGVHWFRVSLGRSLETLRYWTSADTADACNLPPDRASSSGSPEDESVSIDLR